MARKRSDLGLSRRDVPAALRGRLRPPIVVVLGSPAEVVNLISGSCGPDVTCYQLDLHQSAKLEGALAEAGVSAKVATLPDLWDLPAEFQTAVFLPAQRGERELKLDMVEQAFHVLKPGGAVVVWSPVRDDELFAPMLKKIYGKVHENRLEVDAIFWASRQGDRPRRRHEVTFQARIAGGDTCRFLSRPGTFSYGRFDMGARALAEVMEIDAGDCVLDLGCGCGTNGVFAGRAAGETGHVVFIDSNVRAAALAEHNARENKVPSFEVIATHTVTGPADGTFDVVLANPPYFAQNTITRLFIERGHGLLKPRGRFYLVTKQPNEVAVLVEEQFGALEAVEHRGYMILMA
jgi:16S rRNA (guanine1207-N2)-methyltransferase